MKIIGLTGGIGSGKSTVLQFFKELGVTVYIADIEAKKLMNINLELKNKIIKLLGENAYENGVLNRKYISNIVFNNKVKLIELNKLVHPKVQEHFKQFIKKSTSNILIYESAILFESGIDKLCDFVITVTADYLDKIERLKLRDGTTEEDIKSRMQHQFDDEYKIQKSNFVINNRDLGSTKYQVSTIYKILNNIEDE